MKILGLSSDFHDSSAALVVDGRLLATAAEERFTRNKHDSSFPQLATDFCLKEGGIGPGDLDFVVFYERPFSKWVRVLESSVSNWPRSRAEFVESQGEWLGKKLWTKAGIARRLSVAPSRILEVEHHRSHLVQAFVGSPFQSSAVLTIDAVGERSTASFARARWEGEKLVVDELGRADFPHSLGLFYSAITAFLGFKPMNDECSVMALAAFGRPVYQAEFRQVLRNENDGFWRIDPSYLRFDDFLAAPWTEKFTALLGHPRDPESSLPFRSTGFQVALPKDRHWADLAASAQVVLEEALLHSARHLMKVSGEKNLCFAGGVALNCVANTRLFDECEHLYIPVEPGDGGASFGAAFGAYYERDPDARRATPFSIYQGDRGNDLEKMLEELDISHSREYQKMGTRTDARAWSWSRPENKAAVLAENLAAGKVVALFQGRFEMGPRALGHRSILFRPDDVTLAERVSTEIKDRAAFRPYALSLLADEAEALLDLGKVPVDAKPLRWMQLALPVKERTALRAGLHVDGTTRPQLVAPEDDLFFHALLTQVKKRTGVGALVNTSLNESGYPLVGSAEEALLFFARTSLDLLVIDDLVIRKEGT